MNSQNLHTYVIIAIVSGVSFVILFHLSAKLR